MNVEQALAILGLERPASAEAVRRAYLRAVRAHPPERDADGFRLVREAYEFLRRMPWLWQAQPREVPPLATDVATSVLGPDEIARLVREQSPGIAHAEPTISAQTASGQPNAAESASPAVERLRKFEQAFRADDARQAAAHLLELLKAPGEPIRVPAWDALEVTLQLIGDGDVELARELFAALEQKMDALGLGKELGAVSIARSTLVAELLAIEPEVPRKLLVALADGVRDRDFHDAVRIFKRLRSKRAHLTRVLIVEAPSLQRLLVPERSAANFRKGVPLKAWIWIGYLVLQSSYSIVHSALKDDGASSSSTLARVRDDARAKAPAPTESPLVQRARWIDQAVRDGDCNLVHEQWPEYVRAVRAHPESRENYAMRRERVFAMCGELAAELSEEP